MNLVIFANKEFEEEKSLFDLDKEKVIMLGDYYHDKIDGKIEGYLKALEDYNIYNKKVSTKYIGIKSKYFDVIGFYSE